MKALVIDHGLSVELAVLLARDLGDEVGFYSPWASSFADPVESMIGTGLENDGVKRVDFPWSLVDSPDEPDLWVFPDLYFADWQQHLRAMGKNVWGSGDGEILELDRFKLHQVLKDAGQNVADIKMVAGLPELYENLQLVEDRIFIKLSQYYRGLSETYEAKMWPASRSWYEDLARRAGPAADKLRFMLQQPIEGDSVEPGLDMLVLNGKLARQLFIGYESKDSGMISKRIDQIPSMLAEATETVISALGPDYTNFFTGELRVTEDGEVYFIDATCRMPRPGDGAWQNACSNLGEVIATDRSQLLNVGVHAPLVVPTYICQLILNSQWAKDHPLHVRFPQELRDNIKLYYFYRDGDSEYWTLPHRLENFCSVVTTGDDLEKCKKQALDIAKEISADGVSWQGDVFEKIEEEIAKGESYGVDW